MYNSYSALNLLGGMLYTVILLVIAYFVLKIVANWKIFEKAGQPGWASIVPFYSNYIEFNIYWGNGWLFLIPVLLSLLSGIPLLGNLFLVVALIIGAITNYKKAVAFGEGIGFTIGLCLLNPVFNMILAFGHYEYHGIPQDGYSYSQLKTKYEEKKAEQQSNPSTVQYQAPETPKEPSQNYSSVTPDKFDGYPTDGEPEEQFNFLYGLFGNPSGLYWTNNDSVAFNSSKQYRTFEDFRDADYDVEIGGKNFYLVWNYDGYSVVAACNDTFDSANVKGTTIQDIYLFPNMTETKYLVENSGSLISGYLGYGEVPVILTGTYASVNSDSTVEQDTSAEENTDAESGDNSTADENAESSSDDNSDSSENSDS